MSDDPNSDTKFGETAASSGGLGRGKLIVSCLSVGSEDT